MSTCTLCLTQYRQQSKRVPVEQPLSAARQLDLPIECLRLFKVVARWLTPRRKCAGIVYFGKGKYVAIGTSIRRVEIG